MSQIALAKTATPHDAITAVRTELKARFIERDEVVDGILAALIAQQHVLLLGPPGTAKSAIVNAVTASITGASCFSWLVTKFSTPEELFGPVSLAGLQQDRFARITAGKLPEAHVGFIDEVFKASSAILNALLSLANERVFHNDGDAVACPLVTLVGASNELPQTDDGLDALFDRFLLRLDVHYVRDRGAQVAMLRGTRAQAGAAMSLSELQQATEEAAAIELSDELLTLLLDIKVKAEEEGFIASDRRWRAMLDVLRARAWLEGDGAVNEDHVVDVVPDCLWRNPKERPAIAAIVGSVANPSAARIVEIVDAAKQVVRDLGPATTANANERAEWLMNASLAQSQLEEMGAELDKLSSKCRGTRIEAAKATVDGLARDIASRVAALYRL